MSSVRYQQDECNKELFRNLQTLEIKLNELSRTVQDLKIKLDKLSRKNKKPRKPSLEDRLITNEHNAKLAYHHLFDHDQKQWDRIIAIQNYLESHLPDSNTNIDIIYNKLLRDRDDERRLMREKYNDIN